MKRQTRQRQAIQQVIRQAVRPLSPQEVWTAARQSVHGLGIATVYRTINALVKEGELVTVEIPGQVHGGSVRSRPLSAQDHRGSFTKCRTPVVQVGVPHTAPSVCLYHSGLLFLPCLLNQLLAWKELVLLSPSTPGLVAFLTFPC